MELEPGQLKISPMPKTWILDLDGTLLVHDGPYILGKDRFLPGASARYCLEKHTGKE